MSRSCALILLAFAAGCAAATQPQLPAGQAAAARPERVGATGCGRSIVYVTSYNNSVYVYDQRHNNGTPCGQITGVTNPQGLFVDKHRDLWVAIAGDCKNQFSSVLEFAPGGTTPIKTLTDPAGLGLRRRGRQRIGNGLRDQLLRLHKGLHKRK